MLQIMKIEVLYINFLVKYNLTNYLINNIMKGLDTFIKTVYE